VENSTFSWKKNWQINVRLAGGDWKIGMILVTKWFKKWIFQKMSITTKMPLNWYSSMKKKIREIRIIFDIENWLWKSEIRIFQSPPAKRTLIGPKFFFYEKVPFSTQLCYHLMRKLLKKSWMVSTIYQALMETAILLHEDYFCATLGPIH